MSLKQKAISGIGWSSFTQVGEQGITFVITVILARLLSPHEFGLITMITVFTGFAAFFSNFGFKSALIQKENIGENHYSSVFWVNIFIGVFLCLIITGLSPLIAKLYDEPILKPLTSLIAIIFVINSLNIVQQAILEREMKFKILGLRNLVSVISAGATAICLALNNFGAWTLVWKSVISSAVGVILLWSATNWRPRLVFRFDAVRDLLGYSTNLLGSRLVNYWMRNADNMLIGKFLGSTSLGIYSRAYGLMMLPQKQICLVLGRVMFPVLSRMQCDKEQVKIVFLKSISTIALITFPLMIGFVIVADDFVLALYGSKWIEVIPILRILALVGLIESIVYADAWIFTSQGRTDLMFKWWIVQGILIIGSFLFGIWIGFLKAVVIAYGVMSGIILLYPKFAIPGKLINLTFTEVVLCLYPILISASIMGLGVWTFGFFLPNNWSHGLCLSLKIPLGILIYLFTVNLLNLQAYSDVRNLVHEQWGRKFKKTSLSTVGEFQNCQ